MHNESPNTKPCPRCGAGLPPDGMCPACLLAGALARGAMDQPEEDFSAGECGDYELLEMLGRGGNGVVFRARHKATGKIHALKMLASARHAGPDELRRFRLEAEALRSLDHPAIVRITEVGEEDGCPFFAMDFAPGGTLADRLGTMIGHEEGIALMVRVARAVHFAHERGVLHRDLKPENILLDAEGRALVSDFGLARLVNDGDGLTLSGTALGTPSYMSPEQADGGAITTATDQFSLGAILYHLLAGSPPFRCATPMETLRKVVSEDAPDPRALMPGLDRDLSRICLKALRREPGKRYPSVATFADDLERWQRGEPVAARPLPRWERTLKWSSRHPISATFAGTGSLALLALVSMYLAGSWMLREERNHAQAQERIAKQNERDARAARDLSRLNAYAADMYLGFRAFEDGHLGLARSMLAGLVPEPGQRDLRGFEWHLLSRLCKGDDIASFPDHSAAVAAVAFSKGSDSFVSAGRDGKVFLRSFPGGEKLLELPKPDAPRGAAEIPLMAKVAGSSGEAARLILSGKLNPDELRMRARPSALSEVSVVAWSPDGTELLTGGGGGYVRFWEMPEGNLSGVIPVFGADDAGFSGDGRHVFVFVNEPGEQYSWEMRIYRRDGLTLERVIGGLQGAHAFSQAKGLIALMPQDRSGIELHSISGGAVPERIGVEGSLLHLEFSADGTKLFGRDFHGTRIRMWEPGTGKAPIVVGAGDPSRGMFRVSPDGGKIASAGIGQIIRVADARGESATLLRGHEDGIIDLGFSPDGKWLVSGGNDGSCRIWSADLQQAATPPSGAGFPAAEFLVDPGEWQGSGKLNEPLRRIGPSGEVGGTIPPPPERYLRTVSSADSSIVGVVAWPRSAWFYDPDSGRWSGRITLGSGVVGPVVISPDKAWIASGGDDNLVTIREIRTGREIARLTGHQGQILGIAFSPDMQTLASCAADGGLRLWHVPTWRPLGEIGRELSRKRLAFSRDGLLLRAEALDGSLHDFSAK